MIKKIKPLMITVCMSFLVLTACGENVTSDENTSGSGVVTEENNTEADTEKKTSDKDLVRSENVYFWASTLKTGTPNELTNINSVLTTLPITEESLNTVGNFKVDRLSRENEYYTTFSEMLDAAPDTDSRNNPHNWWEDECDTDRENPPEVVYHTHNINEDNQTTRREMFEQGYWYISTGLDNQKAYKIWNEETAKWELFDYYIEVLGEPSYIRVPERMAEGVKTEGVAYYERCLNEEYEKHNAMPDDEKSGFIYTRNTVALVWEYDEYVLQIVITEMFGAKENIMSSGLESTAGTLDYFPKEQWENYWKEEIGKSWNFVDVILSK